jgi:histidine triad (HIT) family protein
MNDCVFCKIICGEISAEKIYEDEYALAFLDAHPNNLGHSLVVPKKHAKNILDIPEETLTHIMPAIQKVSKAVFQGMEASGVNVHINNEPAAGQVVFHLHVHIIPRFQKDGLKMWSKKLPYKAGEKEQTAKKIKAVLHTLTD